MCGQDIVYPDDQADFGALNALFVPIGFKSEDGKMEKLQTITDKATKEINEVFVKPLTAAQAEKVRVIVETTVVRALLEGQHRAVDACLQYRDKNVAQKIADSIRNKNDVLIANLSSMR